jgi:signal transduction histidine kinase
MRSLLIGLSLILALITSIVLLTRMHRWGLPYKDSFAEGRVDGWVPYSGSWRLLGGGITNDSIEPGAKFVAGSAMWTNYSIDADVQLLGEGDAGLIIRAGDLESGADSYRGYYAGLRTRDGKLVLGKADHGWTEFPSKRMPTGVESGRWYHLTLSAYDCVLNASANSVGSQIGQSVTFEDPNCFSEGRFGLRSLYSGGIWRNIHVVHLKGLPQARPDIRTATDSEVENSGTNVTSDAFRAAPNVPVTSFVRPSNPLMGIQSIRNLRLLSATHSTHVIVRGVVILTEPLYVQDASGGVLVKATDMTHVRSGEDVEVEGDLSVDGLNTIIHRASVRPMGGGTSTTPPLSITADQAATGAYQAMLVEVQGALISKTRLPGEQYALQLHDGQQTFYAVATSRSVRSSFDNLSVNSLLMLRGVCLVGGDANRYRVPFTILVVANEDVKVLAGPPWWSPGHLIELAIVMLALGYGAHLLFSRAEEWRLRAVIDERERLAHEIHDTLAQSFAGIGFQLRAIRNRVNKGNEWSNIDGLQEELARACDLVRQSHDEARRTITTLRPDATEAGGLIGALEQIARQMVGPAHMKIETYIEGEVRSIAPHVLDGLFRIGQESIANAIQHGHPSTLRIYAVYGPSTITLHIEDNGSGFEPQNTSDGFGITGIRRRTETIQGTLSIETSSACGTRLIVEAPLPRKKRLFSSFLYSASKS